MQLNFRNALATMMWCGVIAFWILQGRGDLEVPEMINGALVALVTLVSQFYFRKKDAPNNAG